MWIKVRLPIPLLFARLNWLLGTTLWISLEPTIIGWTRISLLGAISALQIAKSKDQQEQWHWQDVTNKGQPTPTHCKVRAVERRRGSIVRKVFTHRGVKCANTCTSSSAKWNLITVVQVFATPTTRSFSLIQTRKLWPTSRSPVTNRRCLSYIKTYAEESVRGGIALCAVLSIVSIVGVFVSFMLCGKMATMRNEREELKDHSEDKGKDYLDNHWLANEWVH